MIERSQSDRRPPFFDFHRLLPKRGRRQPHLEPSEEVIENGQAIAICDGGRCVVEQWVQKVARATDTKLDWMYRAGYVLVYCLGDQVERQRASAELRKPTPLIRNVRILSAKEENL